MEALAVDTSFAPEPLAASGSVAWLSELRRAAFACFSELGFPTPKNEDWRYTGVQPITGTNWARVRREPELTSLPPAGVRVRRLSEALREAEPFLGKLARFDASAFTALNTAMLVDDDALVIEIEKGAVVTEPIRIAFRSRGAAGSEARYPRVLILAGERSQASVVQVYAGEGRYLTNAVTEISVGEGALLEHYVLQQESQAACHVHALSARQSRGSHFTSHNLAFGGALARTDISVLLDAEGAECTLNGLFVGRGEQHLDNHTVVDHAKPRCVSRELYKGVLDDAARGVFHGKVIVRQDAQKTDAVQTNKNLLLSRRALVNSTPALEILADDVKCKHGSTTGQLDAAAVFYLRSRGIGEAAARAMLTQAFAADLAERIKIPGLRAEVERELGARLSAAGAEAAR
jgi:Fe-S cluster assembly protein SufD